MSRASLEKHIVEDGDVVIGFTDGVSDNVKYEEFKECVEANMQAGKVTSLSGAADCLARKAHFLGINPDYVSPFVIE